MDRLGCVEPIRKKRKMEENLPPINRYETTQIKPRSYSYGEKYGQIYPKEKIHIIPISLILPYHCNQNHQIRIVLVVPSYSFLIRIIGKFRFKDSFSSYETNYSMMGSIYNRQNNNGNDTGPVDISYPRKYYFLLILHP